jgi:hypothetical protein
MYVAYTEEFCPHFGVMVCRYVYICIYVCMYICVCTYISLMFIIPLEKLKISFTFALNALADFRFAFYAPYAQPKYHLTQLL